MLLPIVTYPDPILRTPADPVAAVDDALRELARDMIETMIDARGIGLAGPQVGRGLRLIVVSPTGEPEDATVHFNPRILEASKEEVEMEEGCLSLPELRGIVRRPEAVVVEFTNLDGEIEVIEADDLPARIFQHEIDHLDGKLFIEYFGPVDRLRSRRRLAELREDYEASGSG
jgi:peptide deformylase